MRGPSLAGPIIAVALLVCSGCATTLSSPLQRLVQKSEVPAAERNYAQVAQAAAAQAAAQAETTHAHGRVAPANYVADLTRVKQASCQTGES
jgi:hypothetical protein